MKNYFLIAVFCSISLSAAAQTLPSIDTVTIKAAPLTLQGNIKTKFMDNETFYQFIGSYELANGQTLSLFNRGTQKYAAIEGYARHEIRATSANSFIANDRKLALQINFDENGNPDGHVLFAPASTDMARNIPVNSEIILAIK